MQNPRAFNIDPKLLDSGTEPSDRFVYTNYYVPYELRDPDRPRVVPQYRAVYIAGLAATMPAEVRERVLRAYPGILERANLLARRLESPGDHALPTVTDPSEVTSTEQLEGAFASEIGFLFLDRTRIRPEGFAVGEHLLSLSLAPGEELTIEQRTFSKRESTFEELTDQEQTADLELSSTLTSEMTESLDREQSRAVHDNKSLGARVSGEVYGVNVELGPSSAQDINTADRDTTRSSVKNSHVASSKVASRNRSQHKITFRLSTETRFEASSRRVLRNPNTYTPIDLHYFKILQRVRLAQERYGARLCWAPAVRDPAGNVEKRLQSIHDEIYKKAEQAGIGPAPNAPTPPPNAQPVITSQTVNADKWDPVWGNQRYDYEIEIKAPPGYVWDQDRPLVTSSLMFTFTGSRPAAANVVSVGAKGLNAVVFVHVGIEDNANPVKSQFWEARGLATISVSARFIPAANTQDKTYEDAVAAWRKATDEWNAKNAAAKAEAKKRADAEWAEVRAAALAQINPLHETMAVMIANMFPSQYRDDIWEIDYWDRLFDWRNAAVRLYPSWWNNKPARDKSGAPTDFINASWARLYLPIRPNAEELALKWIFAVTQSGVPPQQLATLINDLVSDFTDYRHRYFGDPVETPIVPSPGHDCPEAPEKYICLSEWHDLLPTDGTHLEVLQATTMAADDESLARAKDADDLRKAQVARINAENALRKAALDGGLGAPSTSINLNVGEQEQT
jgi:hypothetical protein